MPANVEFLAYEECRLGLLCLRRRELLGRRGTVVTEITLNHEFLMSSLHTDSEEALASHALDLHAGDELQVLVGGLGLGYTAHAALRSPRIARLEVVEFLPEVIGWMERGLLPLSEAIAAEPRCEIVEGDVYARLLGSPDTRFDLILIDVDHSPEDPLGEESGGFYGEAGLRRAGRHLAPGGVLAVWSYAESSPFTAALRASFDEVDVRPVRFRNELVDEDVTDWLFFARSPRDSE